MRLPRLKSAEIKKKKEVGQKMYKCRSILGVKISNREVDLDLCNFFYHFITVDYLKA